ncbi:MAG: leucine-rich repeat domain-containing protein [Clostridia bacterium]|nr:leucine-rich repeat domain-containing protein [Clostridia bacterium]
MKNFKKLIGVFLGIVLSCLLIVSVGAVDYDIYGIIEEGVETAASVGGDSDTWSLFSFVPAQSGNYTISVSGATDYIYISSSENYVETIEENGYDLKECYLFEKGKTAYIYIGCYSENAQNVKVLVEKSCDHLNTYNIPAVAPTCTEDGKTSAVGCSDCLRIIQGSEVVVKRHTDKNSDRICDLCSLEALVCQNYVNEEETAICKLYINGDVVVEGTGVVESFVPGYDEDMPITLEDGKRIFIGEGITAIEEMAFPYTYVEKVELPSTVEYIGDYAFESVIGEIPANVKSLGIEPFGWECEKYIVDEENENYASVDGVLFSKDKKTLVSFPKGKEAEAYVIPENVENIGESAFCDVELNNLVLPEKIRIIGDSAFSGSRIATVKVPEGVEYIGPYAFDSIKHLIVYSTDCEIEEQNVDFLIGYEGSTAEKMCDEYDIDFLSISEGHAHFYVPDVVVKATCQNEGKLSYSCPCGETEERIIDVPVTDHYFEFDGEEKRCIYCSIIEKEFDDLEDDEDEYYDTDNCNCICHKLDHSMSSDFITGTFKIKLLEFFKFFWKLFGINQTCDCGMAHY